MHASLGYPKTSGRRRTIASLKTGGLEKLTQLFEVSLTRFQVYRYLFDEYHTW